jgi:hypothetical protein
MACHSHIVQQSNLREKKNGCPALALENAVSLEGNEITNSIIKSTYIYKKY